MFAAALVLHRVGMWQGSSGIGSGPVAYCGLHMCLMIPRRLRYICRTVIAVSVLLTAHTIQYNT